ncbi:DNA helicase [Olene mendosa nucleopolyhedrovirus]|uniref:DNA helicase n=1 Tax=Olene mendosa nucleopolyhedrovirus TaxID=2933796 RepID=A0AAX3AX77_9ABAC|nr:DNA helicase [Olene mendosa nucleopolyhedrovirus]UOQ18870.1 DNA helicase [Olene mendosa nucleopolyhedrovirus]
MTTAAISVNQIFENIFRSTDLRDECALEDLDSADSIILRNDADQNKRVVRTYENFQTLLYALTDARTIRSHSAACSGPAACFERHDRPVEPHDWCVQDNCFVLMVRPFIERRHYELIRDAVDFTQFLRSNRRDWGNECAFAGDYAYWPNISITYFGWRLFVKMKLGLELSDCVPLIHHRRLGNVNLFDVQPDFFLNIEMSLTCGARKLFVNGRTLFTDAHDELFEVKQADGSTGRCRIDDRLVYSNKNFFNYLRDDINLVECVTAPRYRSLIRVNLKSLRQFGDAHAECKLDNFEALKITKNITPSSESLDEIKAHIKSCHAAIEDCMVNALSKLDIANGPVLRDYFCKSNFINFDYLIVLVWRLLVKNQEFDFAETDIRLYLELLCENLFSTPASPTGAAGRALEQDAAEEKANATNTAHEIALKRCEPYCSLAPKIFMRFCNHWTLFMEEDALEAIGCYFAIHYAIYYNNTKRNPTASTADKWNYTFESAVTCGLAPEVLAKGFLKKIISANACLVFNGKHYTVVKKDDDLFKLTEKQTAISMSSVKFNSWKYLYFTEEGVYNLVINDYHSPTPFILGNTLLNALTKKNEKTYLPESALNYMLDMGRYERDIYQIYHVAKICRDIRASKTNVAILTSIDNCERCKGLEQERLNELFREVWHYDDRELVIMGLFLNEKKMSDLIANSHCLDCQETQSQSCDCIYSMRVDGRAFRLALMSELFFSSRALRELIWSLIYTSRLYCEALATSALEQGYFMCESVAKHAAFVHQNRLRIVDYLHRLFENVDFVEQLTMRMLTPDAFVACFEKHMECDEIAADDADEIMCAFYRDYKNVLSFLTKWNIWWDRLVVARHDDDLNSWLVRFYMRIIMSRIDLRDYSHVFVRKVVTGYLYFRNFTNHNYTNSLVMMHFDASLAIPGDYEKLANYIIGEANAGKSSNNELMENIFVVHKHDADSYTLSKKETDEMEANKLISQLYVINEMKECNDSFFKNSADSTKSNAVCRKYQSSQKYEANYKLQIVNNKPLFIVGYDKAVRNRFAVVYIDHVYEENLPFSGSVYSHIKNKRYPLEKGYYEGLVTPVRLFLAHILMYRRNPKDGYVPYRMLVKNDPIHNHNLTCLDIHNSPVSALIYVLRAQFVLGKPAVDENKVDKMIELAAPHLETMIHEAFKTKRYSGQTRLNQLCADFKKRFRKCYKSDQKIFINLSMAWNKEDLNLVVPAFKS